MDQGVICSGGISKALKSAALFRLLGCSGTGFSPITIKRVLISFVRAQMEYGLGLAFLGRGLENTLTRPRTKYEEQRYPSHIHRVASLTSYDEVDGYYIYSS